MAVDLDGVTTVLLPGTGSDNDYVRRAFSAPLRRAGAVLVTPVPHPGRLIDGYRAALDDAARDGPVVVGGVSLGAAVAAAWALEHPDRAVAAQAARYTAARLRCDGLAATTTRMRASSPVWLAEELTRSWRVQWPELPDAMEEAAAYVAPSRAELARLVAPLAVAAAVDDPIHPLQVAADWVSVAPHAALRTVTLDEIGADAAALGSACLAALAEVSGA
ncbi:alanine rich protein [Mycobacterium tuberculosis TKK_03_0113]|uniref:alpha/beta hydrolase fold domain-containing protein n=1 Tax=Mycobacterium tuberculosis TaxID=1773 RepID=UPI00045B17C2|nr:alpha/beta hydrolase fold domain-containing protein [Mycobacterium tuberculosis]KAS82686.1 alanine rich protein [Mycobacterium tuberculosis TKK_03_0113]